MAPEQEKVSVLEQARRRTRRDSGSPTRIGLREKRERAREREKERARERERGEYVCVRERERARARAREESMCVRERKGERKRYGMGERAQQCVVTRSLTGHRLGHGE